MEQAKAAEIDRFLTLQGLVDIAQSEGLVVLTSSTESHCVC